MLRLVHTKEFYRIHDGISCPHDENIIVRKCNGQECKVR